jgi:hypothetical protein
MPGLLTPEPLVIAEGGSVIAPLAIKRLPERVDALGEAWQRKAEFHLTAIAARVLDRFERRQPGAQELIQRLAVGRALGLVAPSADIRRVRHPDKPELRTLIVMVDCPGLDELYGALSVVLGVPVSPPPAHVTLYSSDPVQGIGIVDGRELLERAPPLGHDERTELRRAMRVDRAFGL